MGDPTERLVPRSGAVIADRYLLRRRIDAGGMAQVWEAFDTVLHRAVAVKVLHPHLLDDTSFLERFHREATAAARLRHPNIVAVYDTCSTPEVEAIVMELVDGVSLRTLLDEHRTLDQHQVVSIGHQVADALAAAHDQGLVHRDVKPANILLASDDTVRLADFGIAKSDQQTEMTVAGSLVGTATYLSPEQVRGGDIDGRSDLYSLGIVLYEALAGAPPFSGDTPAATALMRLHQAPPALFPRCSGVRPALCDVVMRCLEADPQRRFADAAALRAALASALTDTTGELPVAEPPRVVVRPRRPRSSAREPTTAAGAPSPRESPAPRSSRRPPRSRVGTATLAVLIVSALAVIGLLIARAATDTSDAVSPPTTVAPGPITIRDVAAFDPPPGDGHEGDSKAALVADGQPATAWTTETYRARDFAIKAGVGIIVHLDRTAAVDRVEIDAPSDPTGTEWSATVHVLEQAPTTLPERAAATITDATGNAVAATADARGSYVLVWITRLPTAGRMAISEIRVRGRPT